MELNAEQLEGVSGGRAMTDNEIRSAEEAMARFKNARLAAGGENAEQDIAYVESILNGNYYKLITISQSSAEVSFEEYAKAEPARFGRDDLIKYF